MSSQTFEILCPICRNVVPQEAKGCPTCAQAKARGVLVRPLGDAVAISPPLIATREDIDTAASAIGESIAAVAADLGAAATA